MDKSFLKKFFDLYSQTSKIYSNENGYDTYLFASYVECYGEVYFYDYIDFELCKTEKMRLTLKDTTDKKFILGFLKNTDEVLLYTLYKDFKGGSDFLVKDNIIKLNNMYKNLVYKTTAT